ncbi:2-alkenal reductase [Skermanella stibiiresistens SB22]|uniref:2-alkenal reductase n=1 Tax=Skermanella stibiiresistens SB22 TaxID=1385369 RepID=W9H4E5_9PROT|nr:NADP-dependent oxidoreductase [Skermanella stibiiresistens]EWY39592.1 2-alkenal reductase [Skermanella stibiiresistens SB22]
MSEGQNTRVLLAERPVNRAPVASDFKIERVPVAEPAEGEVLIRNHFLSLDPYMRGRMSAMKSYAEPVRIGGVMPGETVGRVVASRHAGWRTGDTVMAHTGWQEYGLVPGERITRIDTNLAPASHYLGVLGMPGMTAYCALLYLGEPQPGQTVLVSAASGAVGQVVGQIAKIRGCRVVGIAGSDDKIAYVRDELGFDAVLNYRNSDGVAKDFDTLSREVAGLCPDGINVFFDNVGGVVHDAALSNIAQHGRVIICGTISVYNELEKPDIGLRWMRQLLVKRARMEGFLVYDHAHRTEEFRQTMAGWLREKRVIFKEDVAKGIESAPDAFIGMLAGANRGKQLVRFSQD